MKQLVIAQHHFLLHPSGGIFWEETQTWLLADVHLGKVAHFRKNGVAVPRQAEGAFYSKMEKLFQTASPKRIVFLGDLFHSYQNNEWHLFEAWTKQQQAQLVLVTGNHDVIPAWKFKQLGLEVVDHLQEGSFYFSHFPAKKENQFVFCGHVHPGVKLKGSGLQQLKLPCFFHSPQQLILPAIGVFTGLQLVSPKEGDRVYVTSGKEVIELNSI